MGNLAKVAILALRFHAMGTQPLEQNANVALRRSFSTEHHRARFSCLLDLRNFHDRIDLMQLCGRWRNAGYPVFMRLSPCRFILDVESLKLRERHDGLSGRGRASLLEILRLPWLQKSTCRGPWKLFDADFQRCMLTCGLMTAVLMLFRDFSPFARQDLLFPMQRP